MLLTESIFSSPCGDIPTRFPLRSSWVDPGLQIYQQDQSKQRNR